MEKSKIEKKGLMGKFVKLKSTCKTSSKSEKFLVIDICNNLIGIEAKNEQYVCFIDDIESVVS